jgi:hypothetical protein
MRKALKKMHEVGVEFAKAEHMYKVELRKEVLRERAKETAVGVIDKIIYGEDTVAMLRLKRNIAEMKYNDMKEWVMYLKLEIRILDNQISREWHTDDS